VRRTQALDPATLLVDQDRRIFVADFLTQLSNQQLYLGRSLDVPLE
jgi:hypothetical protein